MLDWAEVWDKRDKTFLLLIPKEQFLDQKQVASFFSTATVIDWRDEFLLQVRKEQKRLDLSVQNEIDRIKFWSTRNTDKIILIINTEYLLTYFNNDDRQLFLLNLCNNFPYSKSIIVFCVLDSVELLPNKLEYWEANGRILRLDKNISLETNNAKD
jgi:hypothetical protein